MKEQKTVTEQVQTIYENSFSRIDFAKRLKRAKIPLYRKEGQIVGFFQDKEAINFSSMGLSPEKMERLDLIESKVNYNVQKRLQTIEARLGITRENSSKNQER